MDLQDPMDPPAPTPLWLPLAASGRFWPLLASKRQLILFEWIHLMESLLVEPVNINELTFCLFLVLVFPAEVPPAVRRWRWWSLDRPLLYRTALPPLLTPTPKLKYGLRHVNFVT
jgi:hypothetical protein